MSTLPVVIRREYLDLMDGDHCAAAILNAFEMWSKNKPDFIYKSVRQMHADLMELFGLNRIGDAFRELRRRGFLTARNNPSSPNDQTLQYQFQAAAILSAAARRALSGLKRHALLSFFQTLIIKSRTLTLKHESESISEVKSENKSESDFTLERERFLSEGSDDSKFFKDDPSTLPLHLRTQIPSADVRQQLAAYAGKLGLECYAQVIARCGNARSWDYVLKALSNELPPTPSSAPPPSTDPDATKPDNVQSTVSPDDTPIFDIPDLADDGPNGKTWGLAMVQLELQFDRQTFDAVIKGTRYIGEQGGEWVCEAKNLFARDMLQYRLYRDIRRIVRDVHGEVVELRFVVAAKAVTS